VLCRAVPPIAASAALPTSVYQMPNLKTVDLSWAGRLRHGDPSLVAISAEKVGNPLNIVRDGHTWMIAIAGAEVAFRSLRAKRNLTSAFQHSPRLPERPTC
jgi:ATP-dependent DNA helicase RecQ